MDLTEEQLVYLLQQLICISLVGGMVGTCLMGALWSLLGLVFDAVSGFFERRNRVENARKRAALFSRLAVKSQAEYDRLLQELANGSAHAVGGVVGRACETRDAANAGAQAAAQTTTAKEA